MEDIGKKTYMHSCVARQYLKLSMLNIWVDIFLRFLRVQKSKEKLCEILKFVCVSMQKDDIL